MSIFASVSRFMQSDNAPSDRKDQGLYKPNSGGISTTLGTAIGLSVVGTAAASLYLARKNPQAALHAVKNVFEWTGGKPQSVMDTIDGVNAFSGHPSLIRSLVRLGHNTKDMNREVGFKPIIEEIRQRTSTSTFENLATIKDYTDLLKSRNKTEQVQHIEDALSKLRGGFQRDLRNPATGNVDLLDSMHLGEGIVKTASGDIVDYNRSTPFGMFKKFLHWSHENARIPFTTFSPTDIFAHKAWAHENELSILPKGIKLLEYNIDEPAVAFGNTILTKSGAVLKKARDPDNIKEFEFSGNLYHLQENTALSQSAHALRNELKFRSPDYLADSGEFGFVNEKLLRAQIKLRNSSLSQDVIDQVNAAVNSGQLTEAHKILSDNGGKFGQPMISPIYSREKSFVSNLGEWISRIADDAQPKLREGIVEDRPDSLMGILEHNVRKIKLALKGDVEGYEYLKPDGSPHRHHTMGPIKQYGKEEFAPGAYDHLFEGRLRSSIQNNQVNAQSTVVQGGTNLMDTILTSPLSSTVKHYLVDRPNRLLESATGLGVKPGASVTSHLLRSTLGVSAVMGGAYSAYKFLDFATFNAPSTAMGAAVGAGQIAASGVNTLTGMQTVASTSEEYLPGSVNSLASQVARGVALPFVGALLGGRFLPKTMHIGALPSAMQKIGVNTAARNATGRYVGTAIGAALALASYAIDPTQDVIDQIDIVSGAEKVPIRASRWWMGGRQPFAGDRITHYDYGLSYQLRHSDAVDTNIYGSEAQKWMHSPIPNPLNLFGLGYLADPDYVEDRNEKLRPYPISGRFGENVPIFGPAIGATLGQSISPYISDHSTIHPKNTGYGSYGPSGASQALGMNDLSQSAPDYKEVGSLSTTANRMIDNAQDYAGLFGFMSKIPLNALTGSPTGIQGGLELESSSKITSPARYFNEFNLGGGFGLTEYARRFMGDDPSNIEGYNPLPNQAPDWLPGNNSTFEKDRTDYHLNFSQGDMYRKVTRGEYRLPGAGYEKMNKLHGGSGYDFVDKYNILSDVAPGSEAHKAYTAQMYNYVKGEGAGDKMAVNLFEQNEKYNQKKLEGKYSFVDNNSESVVTHKGAGFESANEYLSFVNLGIRESPKNPVMAPLQNAWEMFSHTRIPMMSSIQGKFLHNRTPLEEYQATQVWGTSLADWNRPVESFIKPAFNEVVGQTLNSNFIPFEVQKRREIEEYYDHLKYLKARTLQSRAEQSGNRELAKEFKAQAQSTMVGLPMDKGGFNAHIFDAAPSSIKPFLPAFIRASESEQKKIRPYLPNNVQRVLDEVWEKQNNNIPIQQSGDNSFDEADYQVADYFSSRAMPGEGSNVWNPSTDVEEYKLQTYQHEGLNYNAGGIPEAKAVEYRTLGRADLILDSSPFAEDISIRNSILARLNRDPSVGSFNVRNSAVRTNSNVHYNDPNRRKSYDSSGKGRF